MRSIVSDDGCAAAGGVGAVDSTGVEPAATIAAAASALRPSRIHWCRIAPRTEMRCGAYGSRSETRRSLMDAEKWAGKNHEGYITGAGGWLPRLPVAACCSSSILIFAAGKRAK